MIVLYTDSEGKELPEVIEERILKAVRNIKFGSVEVVVQNGEVVVIKTTDVDKVSK